jgi:hypothetical protein
VASGGWDMGWLLGRGDVPIIAAPLP